MLELADFAFLKVDSIGMISLILLLGMFFLLAIGMPLGFASAFLAVAVLVMKFGPELLFGNFGRGPLALLSQAIYRQMTNYVLISVPLFIFMAALLERSGIAKDMYSSLNVWMSRTRGGIAIVTSIMAVIMAAMSGIIGGEVVLLGLIALPQMLRLGYNQNLAIGTICASGSLGTMIPPSIVMVVYAASVDVSVGRMFLAGIIPGLLAGFMLMVTIYVIARIKNMPKGDWAGWSEIGSSFREAFWGLFLVVIIMVGIYGYMWWSPEQGFYKENAIFTPTEAAAVASVYAFLVASFVYRDMGPLAATDTQPRRTLFQVPQALITVWVHPDTRRALFDAGKLTVTLMFVIANALILKHVLTEEQIPQSIANAMLSAGFGPVVFLIMVNVILLIGGQFMEPSGLLVIVAPLVFPIAIELGIDPIHLGIIMVVNMEIGMITPPVGLNLFVTAGVAGMSMMAVVRASLPFLAVLFVFLILVTYIPWLSTMIPNALMGPEIITK